MKLEIPEDHLNILIELLTGTPQPVAMRVLLPIVANIEKQRNAPVEQPSEQPERSRPVPRIVPAQEDKK